MKTLLVLIFIWTGISFASEQEIDTHFWNLPRLKILSKEWVALPVSPNRVILSHQDGNRYAILTEERSFLPDSVYEDFFGQYFSELAIETREEMFEKHEMSVSYFEAGSDTHKGIRYGGHSYQVAMPRGTGKFSERFWAFENRFWHVSLVSFDGREAYSDLNMLMESAVKAALSEVITTNIDFSFFPDAHAAGSAQCTVLGLPDLDRIVPKLNQNKNITKCQTMTGIAAGNRSNKYGLKVSEAHFGTCVVNGISNVAKSMREGFASMVNSWAQETERQLKKNKCNDPEPEIARMLKEANFLKKTFIYTSVAPGLRERYTTCLQNAGMQVAGTMFWQSLVQTKDSAVALYNWVKTTTNPWSVILSILATKKNGFMCLTAQAQADYACEFATILVPTLVTGGTVLALKSGLTAQKIISALDKMTGRMAKPLRGAPTAKAQVAPPKPKTGIQVAQASKPAKPAPTKVAPTPPAFAQIRTPASVPKPKRDPNRETVLNDPEEMKRVGGLEDEDRLKEAKEVLGFDKDQDLTDKQKNCILEAHAIGGERGLGTYDQGDKIRKALVLRRCDFTAEQTQSLLDRGIAGGAPAGLQNVAFDASLKSLTRSKETKAAYEQLVRQGNPTPEQINEKLSLYMRDMRTVAQGHTEEFRKTKDLRVGEEALRASIRSKQGDQAHALVQDFMKLPGATRESVMTSLDSQYEQIKKNLEQFPENEIFKRDELGMRELRARLNQPPAKPAPTAPAPKDISRLSPREAEDLGTKQRLANQPGAASRSYLRAAESEIDQEMLASRKRSSTERSGYLKSRPTFQALNESLKSDGDVAVQILEKVRRGGHQEVNKFFDELNATNVLELHQNPAMRSNLRKLLENLSKTQDDLSFPNQSTLKRALRQIDSY